MNKDYKKVIIAVIVVVIIAVMGFWFFKQKTELSDIEKDITTFLEDNVLTEEQKIKLDEALTVLKNNSEDVPALIIVARIKQQASDYDGAEAIYLRAIEIQPNNTVLLNNLGDIYLAQERWEDAEKIYLRIIKQTPKWINAYRELESIYRYHLIDKYSDMEQILLTAIEKTADFTDYAAPDLYTMLGSFYKRNDEVEKAIEYYEIALIIMPENTAVQRELELLKQ